MLYTYCLVNWAQYSCCSTLCNLLVERFSRSKVEYFEDGRVGDVVDTWGCIFPNLNVNRLT
jgi:hypothetical protein